MRFPCFLVTYCTGKTHNNQEKCALCSHKWRNKQITEIKMCKIHLILLRCVKGAKSSVKDPLLFVTKLTLFLSMDAAIVRFRRIKYHFMVFFLTPCRTADLKNSAAKKRQVRPTGPDLTFERDAVTPPPGRRGCLRFGGPPPGGRESGWAPASSGTWCPSPHRPGTWAPGEREDGDTDRPGSDN